MRIFSFMLMTILVPALASAQVRVAGSVSSAVGREAIAGATILADGVSRAVTTNSSGRFELAVPSLPVWLTVSHVGFETRRISVSGNDAPADISLNPLSGDLEEITIASRYFRRYAVNTVSSALRLKGPLVELSQNIQSITPEMIADQASFNITENVSRNVSGTIRMESSNNLGAYMFSRGGQISTLRNGIDLTPLYRGPVPEDAAIIERVEFIKGPSVFMNNIGDPAGSFNVVTKQPTGKPSHSIQAMVGSRDFYRLATDLDGLLSRNGKLKYRLNAMAMKSNSFVRFDHNDRLLIAPMLKYDISARTSISAEYNYQQFSYALMSPLVMSPRGFGTLPSDFSIHESSLPPYRPRDHSGLLTLTHQLNAGWSFTMRGAMMHNRNEGIYMWVTEVNPADPEILLRNPKYDLTRTTVFSQQAFVNGKFRTGGVEHLLLAGVDVNQKRLKLDNYVSYDNYIDSAGNTRLVYYPLNIDDPQYGAEIPGYTTPGGINNVNTFSRNNYYSLYAVDEASFFSNKLRVTLGGRFTSIRTENIASGKRTATEDTEFTPRVGVSYSIQQSFTVFGLFDRTIVPQAGVTAGGDAIKPLRGRNMEVGVKRNWFGGRWNTTLSLYSIRREGIVSADPDNIGYQVQVGETRSKGVDIDIVGQIATGLNIVMNYAYNDAQVSNDVNEKLIGMPTGMHTRHVQNTWLNYQFPASALLKDFYFSVGYQYQGRRGDRYTTANPVKIPEYFRLDGGLGWRKDKIKIGLMVNNLLNKQLLGTPWFRSGLYYWAQHPPIMGRLTLQYTL